MLVAAVLRKSGRDGSGDEEAGRFRGGLPAFRETP